MEPNRSSSGFVSTSTFDDGERYGETNSLADWLAFAALAQRQQYQLLFEAYGARAFEWYSGVVMWKTQSPWPALRGFLYDWYLEPTGGHRGAAAANAAARHVQVDPRTREVVLVDRPRPRERTGGGGGLRPKPLAQVNGRVDAAWTVGSVALDWVGLDGTRVDGRRVPTDATVAPSRARRTGIVAEWPEACSATCFLFVAAGGDANAYLSGVFKSLPRPPVPGLHGQDESRPDRYWFAPPGDDLADYRALGALRRAPAGDAALEVTCSRDAFGATILVDARAASLLVDPHFAVAEAGAPVWPLFSEGAPPAAVRPGAAWRTTLFSRPRGARVRVSLEAFNLAAPVFVDVACTAP